MKRIAELERNTKETRVRVRLDLDGPGEPEIATGIAFFDHMLTLFAAHGFFDLAVHAEGDLEAATRYFQNAAAAGPRNPVAQANLGSVLLRRERYPEAADAYEEATRIAPGMSAAWRGLGPALWKGGDPKRALEALRRAQSLAPDDPLTKRLIEQVRATGR